jgi:3-oxoacyl-[acyl-carrier-protein] synthase-3
VAPGDSVAEAVYAGVSEVGLGRSDVSAVIAGAGFYVPPRVVTNDDLERRYGIDTSHAWIEQRTGIAERRYAEDGVGTADLALEAARAALADARLPIEALDLVVFATLSPDRCFPGSGVMLQQKLGLCDAGRFIPCLDVRNQCSGFVYGLSVADAMIRAGNAEHVLVVGAETQSHALDLTTEGRAVACLFGDGAGAMVLSRGDGSRGVREVHLGADGRFVEALSQKVWDISRFSFVGLDEHGDGHIPRHQLFAQMNGALVFKHAVTRMVESVNTICARAGIQPSDVDLFLFHQANLRINQLVASELGLRPDQVMNNIARYGNTTAATLPILFTEARAAGRAPAGSRVVFCAFGSGFTWGAALVDL